MCRAYEDDPNDKNITQIRAVLPPLVCVLIFLLILYNIQDIIVIFEEFIKFIF